jgi:2-polyprenyl-3-methyl-5-hydroxy-6-metoxy-1,4-benzoquinol methylase
MSGYSIEDSSKAWEANAQFWDNRMGDESNQFHREVIRPKVSELLDIKENDFILDIACGNGNYSAYIAERGADVVAFDYSTKVVALAERGSYYGSTAITMLLSLLITGYFYSMLSKRIRNRRLL